jgi:exopolysaccharide biosynthesis polyprenyl glycosylphosphotransferase
MTVRSQQRYAPDPQRPSRPHPVTAPPATRPTTPTGKAPQVSRVRRSRLHRGLFLAVNAAAALVAVGLAGGTVAGVAAFAAAVVGVDLLDRYRAARLSLSALDEVPSLAVRGIAVAGLSAAVGLPVVGAALPGPEAAGPVVIAALYTGLASAGLGVGYEVLRRLRAAGRLSERAVVVGAGEIGRQLVWRLRDHPEYGLVPLGLVDRVPAGRSSHLLPAPVLADPADLPAVIRENRVQHVFVASTRVRDAELVDLLRACDRLDCEMFVVPRLFELGTRAGPGVDHLWGIPLVRLNRAAFRCHSWTLKRVLDVILAAAGLVLAGPLMAGIALALRREVGPSVLFRQERTGLDGRPFELLKFRTLRPQPDGTAAGWSQVDPDQVGPVGRFLRRTSLDELPQLYNVLRGQMSLVGPRPEQPRYVGTFARTYPGYSDRLRAPAGMTGWAQIHNLRGPTSIDDRVRFDNFYIEHWSLGQDIKILFRTVASVIRMRGG